MRIQTFSILTGSEACNARCPFCISKMTPGLGADMKAPEVNWRNFRIACRFAKQSGVTTAMFTGKGEPTLFPDMISSYLDDLAPFEFPFIELQTNGIMIAEDYEKYAPLLEEWYKKGMTAIALSAVHFEAEKNRTVYLPHRDSYIDLPALIQALHSHGFTVRLICLPARGYIETVDDLVKMIAFAKNNRVEQLTFTPITRPDASKDPGVWEWTGEHSLSAEEIESIRGFLFSQGRPILHLVHGAVVFDVEGQNVCLNNCLSVQADAPELRNLIFFPDGHLRYYWQYPGAILL